MNKNMLYSVSTIVFISAICLIAAYNIMQSDAAEKIEYRIVKEDSELKFTASKVALTAVVVKKDTKVKYVETVKIQDGTEYIKVEIAADENYEKDYIGYILSDKLLKEVVYN